MKIDFTTLKNSIQIISVDSKNLKVLSQLVKISRIVACSYLNNIRPSLHYLYQQQGITTTDLSYDCIAEIFSRDENDSFYRIEKFCKSLNDSLEKVSEIDIFLAWKSFLIKVVDAQLARLYSQSDPTGTKILRNIRDVVRESDYFIMEKTMSGNMLVPKNVNPLYHLPSIPIEKFESEYFTTTFDRKSSFNEQIAIVYNILTGQSEYRRTILLLDISKIFKHRFFSDSIPNNSNNESSYNVRSLTNLEIEEFESRVLSTLKEKIFLQYFAKGKFNKAQAEGVYFAVRDIVNDWCLNGECEET
ncbi:MAG: hypothetical protein FJ213_12715, partial [Ignavibacteria bacterium]|nr:hypothetical protein [Ignavibacteria bacterium]